MIDLDDQLTAYSEYLDHTERSVVVLRPERFNDQREEPEGSS